MDAKMKMYFEFGAREVWRVDHKKQSVTIYLRDASRVVADDVIVTTPLIPGLALSLKEIFGA